MRAEQDRAVVFKAVTVKRTHDLGKIRFFLDGGGKMIDAFRYLFVAEQGVANGIFIAVFSRAVATSNAIKVYISLLPKSCIFLRYTA